MKVNILSRIARRPKPSPPFQAINGQRDHANRHREQKPAWNVQLLLPQCASAQYEADRIATSDSEKPATAKTFPRLIHEPTHCANHYERTQIVGYVSDIEFWFFGRGWVCLQRLPEQISLITRYAGTCRRVAEFILGNIHKNLMVIALDRCGSLFINFARFRPDSKICKSFLRVHRIKVDSWTVHSTAFVPALAQCSAGP